MIKTKDLLTKKEISFLNTIIKSLRNKKQSKHTITLKLFLSMDIFETQKFDYIIFNSINNNVIGFVNEEWKYE